MKSAIHLTALDLYQLRSRLIKMTDAQLLRWGKTARSLCSSDANFGEPPLQTYVVQLEEVRAEWKRRYPAGSETETV